MTINYVLAAMLAGVKQQDLDNSYQVSDAKAAMELGQDTANASTALYANTGSTDPTQNSAIGVDLSQIAYYAAKLAADPSSSDAPAWQEEITQWNAQYGADSAAASNFVNNGQTNVVQPMTAEAQQDSSDVANSGQFISAVLSSMNTLSTLLTQALA